MPLISDGFCDNCLYYIDEWVETKQDENNLCEHYDPHTREWFGAELGEAYRFAVISEFLDSALEEINTTLEENRQYGDDYDKALSKLMGMDDEDQSYEDFIAAFPQEDSESMSRHSRRRGRNTNKQRGNNIIGDAIHGFSKVISGDKEKYSRGPKYSPEERARIVEQERHGISAS